MSFRLLPVLVFGLIGLLPTLSEPRIAPAIGAGPGASNSTPSAQDPSAQDKVLDPNSAASCGTCHTAIHAEWTGRKHNLAWDDEVYQAAIKKKKRARTCYGCHIPNDVLGRLPRKPSTRTELKHEGVNCVACHVSDGVMHGPHGTKTDAHPTVKDPLFEESKSSGLCMACHQTKIDVVLPVGKDFVKAKLAEKGKSCVGCHMPEISRHLAVDPKTGKAVGEKRKGRSHALLGPNDPEFCASAFKLSAAKKGGKLVVGIANEAGHRVPGLRTREFHFRVTQKNAAGKTLGKDKIVVSSENGLLTEEARDFPFALSAGAASVEVVIEHHFMGKLVAAIATENLKL